MEHESLDEALLFALEDLRGQNFKRFKNKLCYLKKEGRPSIPQSKLQDADCVDMLHLLLDTYGEEGAQEVAVYVLRAINLRDSANRLQEWKHTDCRIKYKQHIQETFWGIPDLGSPPGMTVNLHQRYTELLLSRVLQPPKKTVHHEIVSVERRHQEMTAYPEDSLAVSPEHLFNSGVEGQSSRAIVLLGPAGVGKTTAMCKIMSDWAASNLWQERFNYAFYISCGALSHINEPTAMSVADLLLGGCPPDTLLMEDVLMNEDKTLLLLDGFDELTHQALAPADELSSDPHKKHGPASLVLGLLGRKLLPRCHLMVATRPVALDSLQLCLKVPQFVEVLGFRPAQREEFFHRFFQDEEKAAKAFEFVRRNETVFSRCFLPALCQLVGSIFRKKCQTDSLGEIPEAATLTEVHMLLLFTFLECHSTPLNLEGLCTLARKGMLCKTVAFDKNMLDEHGLASSDLLEPLSASARALPRDTPVTAAYRFIYLGFQEFFAALFYLLDSATSPKPVKEVWGDWKENSSSYLMLVRFLFGLCNPKLLRALQEMWCCKTSDTGVRQQLLKWVEGKAQHHSFRTGGQQLELCRCIYETEDPEFAKRVMAHVHDLDLQGQLSTKLDLAALSFCLQASDALHSLRLSGYGLGPTECSQLFPGLLKPSDISMNQCGLTTAACEVLASVVLTHHNLVSLDLSENPLEDLGIIHICKGLVVDSCRKLRKLRLSHCDLTAAACDTLALVVASNPHLTELDLCDNCLGDSGVSKLCQSLKQPQSMLQKLMLHRCGLTAAVCEELASLVESSEALAELGLGGNKLEDAGVKQLCTALKKPQCKLRRLELTMTALTPATKEKLKAARACHPLLSLIPYYRPGHPAFPGGTAMRSEWGWGYL